MDAVEFMKESNRMCKAFNENCKSKDGNNFFVACDTRRIKTENFVTHISKIIPIRLLQLLKNGQKSILRKHAKVSS